MTPYEFGLAGRPWPTGASVLHVYAGVDFTLNPELAQLISRWREAIEADPIRPLADDALHITIDAITDTTASQVSAEERRELSNAIRTAVASAPVYRGFAAGCLSTSSGAVVNISPAQPLTELHYRVRAAIKDLRGPAAVQAAVSKAHISLGYCHQEVDSDVVQRHLRAVDPSHAPVVIDALQLVDVHADTATGDLAWHTVDTFPLR